VLIVSAPLLGHLLPMIPLAKALRAAGHSVLIATGEAALKADTGGIDVRDVAPGFRFDQLAGRTMLRHPLIARAELAGTAGTRVAGLLFGAANDRMAGPLVELARQWRPGLVIHEPLAASGAIAAAAAGVPAVLVEIALLDGPQVLAATIERMGETLARHGVGAVPDPALVVTVRPRSLGASPEHRPMRPGPGEVDTADVPEWLCAPAERPRIVVSRSTVAGPPIGDPMPAVVRAARGVDAEIVLVRPSRRLDGRPMPASILAVGWVPLAAVLPHATAVVHHGGAGTVLEAFAAGIPQLAVPGPGDRRHNADVVARRGAGLAVPARSITSDGLTRLVTDKALAAAAAQVAAEIAEMPPPASLVPVLTALR
jgi:hypothetical protein